MSIQSEAALEAGLIATLRQMGYEYVQITEEDNLYANFNGSWKFTTRNNWRKLVVTHLRMKSLRR